MGSKVITIYDAHTALINARFDKAKATFEKFEAKVDASIKGALCLRFSRMARSYRHCLSKVCRI